MVGANLQALPSLNGRITNAAVSGDHGTRTKEQNLPVSYYQWSKVVKYYFNSPQSGLEHTTFEPKRLTLE